MLGCYVLYVSPLYLSVGRIDPQRLCGWGTRSDRLRLQNERVPCCHPVLPYDASLELPREEK
jgi:hypothetical protein